MLRIGIQPPNPVNHRACVAGRHDIAAPAISKDVVDHARYVKGDGDEA